MSKEIQTTERPILFSAPMIRAILDGTKTQTRRVVSKVPTKWKHLGWSIPTGNLFPLSWLDSCPYGQTGDRLWVRETWTIASKFTDVCEVRYKASKNRSHTEFVEQFPVALASRISSMWPKYRPSIHMPRWASRIDLEITSIRVERLQDISDDDVFAEGCPRDVDAEPRDIYMTLWEQINGNGSWAANPWVWIVEFKRVRP